jgi:hypothetical protein
MVCNPSINHHNNNCNRQTTAMVLVLVLVQVQLYYCTHPFSISTKQTEHLLVQIKNNVVAVEIPCLHTIS